MTSAPARLRRTWLRTLYRGGGVALGAGLVAYLGSTIARTAGDGGRSTLWDDWVFNAIVALAAVLVLVRVSANRQDRLVWGLVAGALVLQGVVGTAYSLDAAGIGRPATATLSAIAPLAYLFMYAAVVIRLRRTVARVGRSVWLDGLIAALGIATLCAAFVLEPIIDHAAVDGSAVVSTLVSPIADLGLLCMVGSAMVVMRRELDRVWWLLAGAFALYALADASFAVRIATGTYEEGSPFDAGWPAAAVLFALAALRAPAATRRLGRLAGQGLLALPALCGAAALAVLVADHAVVYGWLVPITAGATLVAVSLRAALAFREARDLAESRRLSVTDDLTGLANRRLLLQQLTDALDHAEPVALLLVDLDRFKEVNDSLGHEVGDELLRRAASRLAAVARPQDTVARLGGDEFAILLRGTSDPRVAEQAAERVRGVLALPLPLEGLALQVSASTGIALAPVHAEVAGELLRAADVAMYQAKARRDAYRVYDPAGDQGGRERLRQMGELRTALTSGELELHYQPLVRVPSGVTERVEALVRWRHPRLGLLQPGAFLPLAEQAGLMGELCFAVLDLALRDCSEWQSRHAVTVAVNLSPSTLADPRLVGEVARLLAHHGVPGESLMVEITEDALADDPERARAVLAALRRHGVGLAVDDYGAGYSSLAHLRDLRVDELKLDRSFVTGLGDDPIRCAIVRTTIGLARALHLRMVAEGVETAQDWHELVQLGCDLAQGYHIARPMPRDQLVAWLEQPAAAAA